jgi:hypothetical protein
VGLPENADHAALDATTTVHVRGLPAWPARKSVLSVVVLESLWPQSPNPRPSARRRATNAISDSIERRASRMIVVEGEGLFQQQQLFCCTSNPRPALVTSRSSMSSARLADCCTWPLPSTGRRPFWHTETHVMSAKYRGTARFWASFTG